MKFNNSHKALAITLLLTGTLVLSVFNYSVIKSNIEIAETLIDITPAEVLEELEKEQIEQSAKTNKALNTEKEYKHFAQAYKPIAPPKDYENELLNKRNETPSEIQKATKNNQNSSVKNEELTTFKSVNSILNKRTNANQTGKTSAIANKNTSIYYSLKNREAIDLPIPVYLCEAGGKIVINITVDGGGHVIDAHVNGASTSKNECLKEQALQYAEDAVFNASTQEKQGGSITFIFKGKL